MGIIVRQAFQPVAVAVGCLDVNEGGLENVSYEKEKPRSRSRTRLPQHTLRSYETNEQTSPGTIADLFVCHCAWSPITSVH